MDVTGLNQCVDVDVGLDILSVSLWRWESSWHEQVDDHIWLGLSNPRTSSIQRWIDGGLLP